MGGIRQSRHPSLPGYNDGVKVGTEAIDAPDPEMVELLRSKTAAERLSIACGMWRAACSILLNVLREQHPDWDQHRIDREVASRLSHGSV